MIEEVKTAFKQRLETRDWLDQTTKNRSIDKVNAITQMVAYPDQIFNNTWLNDFYKEVSTCMHVSSILQVCICVSE